MFELLQIISKLVIIGAIVILAILLSLRVWRADLDLRQILNPKRAIESTVEKRLTWLPTREKDALYQGGRILARVSGAVIDEAKSTVRFDEIYNSNELNLGAEFEFQKWRLRFRSAESVTMVLASAPQKGRIIEKAVCEIAGLRPAI